MPYLIGIDIGTSGTKTCLFDADGTLIASATGEYPLSQPHNGWAEQDPEDWWQATVDTLRAVTDKIDPKEIAGVGFSGQMHGLVMLDEAGDVIRPSIIWCDQRTAAECEEIEATVGHEKLLAITANPALTGFTASKILWVRNHEPENWAKCRRILLPKDYIRYRLTGEFATDVSDAGGMQLLDIGGRCWSDELLSLLKIDKSLLAKVYESPEITGYVTERSAMLTGLATGTPVVAGAGDNAAAAVGTGIVTEGDAFVTVGTSGVIFAHTNQMVMDPGGRVHTFCCAVPGKWHVMGVTQAAGLSLKWFANQCCQDLTGEDRYDKMTAEAAESPIGSNRLLYLPYLMGERTPHLDADARGVFFGLSGSHTRGDMIRAVLEGVSYSLRDCLEVLREMGVHPENITACGGGARSPLWRGMMANLFGTPIRTAFSSEGAALGAAILAGVGTKVYPSVEEACAKLIQIRDTVEPEEAASAAYGPYYSLYRQIYPAVKGLYKDLAQI